MVSIINKELLIIGAGPVGIFTSFQANLLGIDNILIDSLSEVGGQLTSLYQEKYIYDIPGYPKILAKDLIQNLMLQLKAENKDQTILLNQEANTCIKQEDGSFIVNTKNDLQIHCKAIIIAVGAGSHKPNKPQIENIIEFEDKNIFYNVNNPDFFKDKTLAIAGGGDSALDWCITLAPITKKIYMIHRRDTFRGLESSIKKLYDLTKELKVELLIPYIPVEVLKDSDNLFKGLILKNLDGTSKTINCDSFLAFFGLTRSLSSLANWGLNINTAYNTINVTQEESYETNIKGIFAVGDVASYKHKLKLIMVGFSEASYALHKAWEYINPSKKLHFTHSTSKKIEG